MIVRTSLLGSIIVNILLVLGVAIITGEFQLRGQRYSIFATRIAAALLGLTTVSLLVPVSDPQGTPDSCDARGLTHLQSTIRTSKVASKLAEDVLNLSRGISIVLMLIYVLSLFTQMRSTRFGYAPLIKLDPDGPEPIESVQIEEMAPRSYHRRTLSYPRDASMSLIFDELPIHTTATEPRFRKTSFLDIPSAVRKANSVPWIRKCVPFIGLLASTAMIALCGGYLLESIDHVVDHSPFSKTTVGLIILPLVGNAAELVSGIMFASRKQMDLAFAVSIGSAIQMALFVTPLMVLVGWGIGREMSLHFTLFESISLIASTVSFSSLVLDDRCSMLKGIGLLVGYIIIGLVRCLNTPVTP
jgi:Ca2+:H+ antiporter